MRGEPPAPRARADTCSTADRVGTAAAACHPHVRDAAPWESHRRDAGPQPRDDARVWPGAWTADTAACSWPFATAPAHAGAGVPGEPCGDCAGADLRCARPG